MTAYIRFGLFKLCLEESLRFCGIPWKRGTTPPPLSEPIFNNSSFDQRFQNLVFFFQLACSTAWKISLEDETCPTFQIKIHNCLLNYLLGIFQKWVRERKEMDWNEMKTLEVNWIYQLSNHFPLVVPFSYQIIYSEGRKIDLVF